MLSNNRKVQKGKSHETKKKEKQLKTIIKNKSFFVSIISNMNMNI